MFDPCWDPVLYQVGLSEITWNSAGNSYSYDWVSSGVTYLSTYQIDFKFDDEIAVFPQFPTFPTSYDCGPFTHSIESFSLPDPEVLETELWPLLP